MDPDQIEQICKAMASFLKKYPFESMNRQDMISKGMFVQRDPIIASLFLKLMDNDSESSGIRQVGDATVMIYQGKACQKGLTNEENILLNDYDKDVYLDRLLACARSMNNGFDACMERWESEMIEMLVEEKESELKLIYLKCAPVKGKERTKSKVGTDYNDAIYYPKSARILDLLRCSLTFANVDLLLAGVDLMMKKIVGSNDDEEIVGDDETNRLGFLSGMARVKNMFEGDDRQSRMEKNGTYRDIKCNAVYFSVEHDMSMICEIQFILESFLMAKKSQHRLYSIVRGQDVFEIVDAIANDDYLTNKLIVSAHNENKQEFRKFTMLGADVNELSQDQFDEIVQRQIDTNIEFFPRESLVRKLKYCLRRGLRCWFFFFFFLRLFINFLFVCPNNVQKIVKELNLRFGCVRVGLMKKLGGKLRNFLRDVQWHGPIPILF